MKIDGTKIAAAIYEDLTRRVEKLKKDGITPTLTVILVGDNPASVSYIKQKKKFGDKIGAKVNVIQLDATIAESDLLTQIAEINKDSSIHGVIIQLPLPAHINEQTIIAAVNHTKDIDGFLANSPYKVPIALAVASLLKEAHSMKRGVSIENTEENFQAWLKNQSIVILGKGRTAGMPIYTYFVEQDIHPTVITTSTEHPQEKVKNADILISAVGKSHVVKAEDIKKGAIVIGVGLFRGDNGEIHGDYDEETIAPIAQSYTSTPGGVGPVNVAMLLSNLVLATENSYRV